MEIIILLCLAFILVPDTTPVLTERMTTLSSTHPSTYDDSIDSNVAMSTEMSSSRYSTTPYTAVQSSPSSVSLDTQTSLQTLQPVSERLYTSLSSSASKSQILTHTTKPFSTKAASWASPMQTTVTASETGSSTSQYSNKTITNFISTTVDSEVSTGLISSVQTGASLQTESDLTLPSSDKTTSQIPVATVTTNRTASLNYTTGVQIHVASSTNSVRPTSTVLSSDTPLTFVTDVLTVPDTTEFDSTKTAYTSKRIPITPSSAYTLTSAMSSRVSSTDRTEDPTTSDMIGTFPASTLAVSEELNATMTSSSTTIKATVTTKPTPPTSTTNHHPFSNWYELLCVSANCRIQVNTLSKLRFS